jgi:hypothetical protein
VGPQAEAGLSGRRVIVRRRVPSAAEPILVHEHSYTLSVYSLRRGQSIARPLRARDVERRRIACHPVRAAFEDAQNFKNVTIATAARGPAVLPHSWGQRATGRERG